MPQYAKAAVAMFAVLCVGQTVLIRVVSQHRRSTRRSVFVVWAERRRGKHLTKS